MLELEGLSTEAKIGKILILVAVVLGVISLLSLAVIGYVGQMPFIPAWIGGAIIVIAIVKIIGIIIGVFAFLSSEDGNYPRAGVLAIVSSVVPPLDLVMLIGGIFCLISPEAKKKG